MKWGQLWAALGAIVTSLPASAISDEDRNIAIFLLRNNPSLLSVVEESQLSSLGEFSGEKTLVSVDEFSKAKGRHPSFLRCIDKDINDIIESEVIDRFNSREYIKKFNNRDVRLAYAVADYLSSTLTYDFARGACHLGTKQDKSPELKKEIAYYLSCEPNQDLVKKIMEDPDKWIPELTRNRTPKETLFDFKKGDCQDYVFAFVDLYSGAAAELNSIRSKPVVIISKSKNHAYIALVREDTNSCFCVLDPTGYDECGVLDASSYDAINHSLELR